MHRELQTSHSRRHVALRHGELAEVLSHPQFQTMKKLCCLDTLKKKVQMWDFTQSNKSVS